MSLMACNIFDISATSIAQCLRNCDRGLSFDGPDVELPQDHPPLHAIPDGEGNLHEAQDWCICHPRLMLDEGGSPVWVHNRVGILVHAKKAIPWTKQDEIELLSDADKLLQAQSAHLYDQAMKKGHKNVKFYPWPSNNPIHLPKAKNRP